MANLKIVYKNVFYLAINQKPCTEFHMMNSSVIICKMSHYMIMLDEKVWNAVHVVYY